MAADLSKLTDEITKTRGVVQSATVFVNSVPQKLQDAIDAALANGATAAQLKPVQDLGDALQADADALVAAMQANP